MNCKLLLSIAALVGAVSAAGTGPHGSPMCDGCTVTGTGGDNSLWGWENEAACEIDTSKCGNNPSAPAGAGPHGQPLCSGCTVTSTGGDNSLWGWENNAACEIDTNKCGGGNNGNSYQAPSYQAPQTTKSLPNDYNNQNNYNQNNYNQNNYNQGNTKQIPADAWNNNNNNYNQNNYNQGNTKQIPTDAWNNNNNQYNQQPQQPQQPQQQYNGGGASNLRVIGEKRTGKTTRYWDCCKPSCAWSGKASVSSPVGTCSADGSRISDVNAKSGCDGGNAYMCTDQQPWAINDQLSYGFAAAAISGGSESSWCCACYRLTFTSTSIAGKQLVVQVTNTGGDLGENHFDLQMPGGGLGIFDGCSSQFGVDANSWGQRYGGLSSAAECSKLPASLQKGCEWRFGWFENADNPSMEFEEVECPAELTQKTGCVRR